MSATIAEAIAAIQRLRESMGADVALAYSVQQKKAYVGVVEVGRRANTAFLNLVHGQTNYNQKVFLSYQPTEADLGTYIEQFKTNDAALYSCVHGACQKFVPERSTAGSRQGQAQPADTVLETVTGNITRVTALFQKLATGVQLPQDDNLLSLATGKGSEDWHVLVSRRLAAVDPFTPQQVGSEKLYDTLGDEAKKIFDSIFTYASYALSSGRVVQGAEISVGSLLAGPSGQVLSWGVDMSALNHAEVTTLKRYLRTGEVPGQNLRLYTSLKPCYMCSGWIRDIFSGNHVTVVSGQLDPRLANQQLQNALAAHQIPSLGMNSESATKLEQKRQQLDQIAKADNSRNAYKKQQFESAIEHSKLVPGRRYHAKALILLAELGASIHALPEPEKIHLTAVLSHVKEFFQTVTTTTNFGQILANVAAFLDRTRGTHPLKATDQVYQAAAAVKAGQPKYGPRVQQLGA